MDEVLIELYKNAKEGELLYDENQYTDQDLEFRISEIIREKNHDRASGTADSKSVLYIHQAA